MLRFRHITSLALLFTGFLTTSAQQTWTLQQCIDHAVVHNISVEEARLRLASSQQQLSASQHRYLPSLSASASQSLNLGRSADKTGVIGEQSSSSTSFGANLSWEVFSGLSRPKTTEIARLNSDVAAVGLTYAQEQIGLQVAEGYYNLLYRQEMIHVAESQLSLTHETLTKTEALVKTGKWSRDRLAEVEAQLAKDSVNYLKACSDAEIARHQLALIIEIPDYTELQVVSPDVKESSSSPAPELALSDEVLIERARAFRPEMEQAKLQLQVAERQVELEKTRYIPKLSLGAGYNTGSYYVFNESMKPYNQPFGEQMRNNGRYFVGLSLSIPIFDALQTQDNVDQARLRYSDQQIALLKSDKQLTQQLYTAQINARAAYSQIAAAERASQSAEIALHYAQLSYDAGRVSSYQLAEAQNRHSVAQSEELRARYDYLYRVFVLQSYISPMKTIAKLYSDDSAALRP